MLRVERVQFVRELVNGLWERLGDDTIREYDNSGASSLQFSLGPNSADSYTRRQKRLKPTTISVKRRSDY